MQAIRKKKLGEMLVEAGLLGQEELSRILGEQRGSGMRLGEYLVNRAILKEAQIIDLVSRQLAIDTYSSEKYSYDVYLESVLPAELAQRHRIVPVARKGRLLTVATPDPMDIAALDAVEIHTGLEVEPVICTEKDFEALTYALYGIANDLGGVMDGMEDLSAAGEATTEEMEQGPDVAVASLQDMAEEAPVVRLVNSILTQAVREGASDVHISPEKDHVQLRFRVDGRLREVPAPPRNYFLPIVSRLKILANMDIAVAMVPQDGRFTFNVEGREVHVRASTLPTIHGENMILRLLMRTGAALGLDDLGMPEAERAKIEAAIVKPYGMILTTGPTGSGKSTTLYAVLRRLNTPDINIVTLEDPVEYRVPKIRQVQLNRKAGMTFASGLRSILRQDPDVIMVGEIRDQETARIAVQAAMTGHRLLSTLHTNDAAGAVTRLIEMGVEPFLVASTLLVSIAQRLVRRVCPHCREVDGSRPAGLALLGLPEDGTYYRAVGCRLCGGTGYSGRVGLYEILEIDSATQGLILARAAAPEIARAAMDAGRLRLLRDDAAHKVAQGLTTVEEALTAVLV